MDAILEAWIREHPGQDWQAHERAVTAEMERRLAAYASDWLPAQGRGPMTAMRFYQRDEPTLQRWAERGWLPTRIDLDRGCRKEVVHYRCDPKLRTELYRLHPVQRTPLASRSLMRVAS